MTPDMINGLFEGLGTLFILTSVVKLYNEKLVRGVSWVHMSFFMTWGFWNLYYYPHLEQWWSFVGGIGIVVANTVYVGQLLYYTWRENKWWTAVAAHEKRQADDWLANQPKDYIE